MAIEHAMILARTLASLATPEEALQRYQSVRMGRVNAVADASEAMGRLFHTDDADYSQARDMTAGQMGRAIHLRRGDCTDSGWIILTTPLRPPRRTDRMM